MYEFISLLESFPIKNVSINGVMKRRKDAKRMKNEIEEKRFSSSLTITGKDAEG